MLQKHSGTTTDKNGCEFHYVCYTRKDRILNQETWTFQDEIERQYVCCEFPEISAPTLNELKAKLSIL